MTGPDDIRTYAGCFSQDNRRRLRITPEAPSIVLVQFFFIVFPADPEVSVRLSEINHNAVREYRFQREGISVSDFPVFPDVIGSVDAD